MGRVTIRPVTTEIDRERFLDVPRVVYVGDRNWVEPIRSSISTQLWPSGDNPFLEYGEFQAFVATDEAGRSTGRIVAAVNRRLNERDGRSIGLFGYFECIDDAEVGRALLETALSWLRDRGMTLARGPIDLSTHNSCLFLVDGFDSQPAIMMPYNPPHYPKLMEREGWTQAKDAYAYDFPMEPLSNKFEKAYRVALKAGVTFRSVNLKGDAFDRDVRNIYQLFTQAFSNNWSSSPRSEEEFFEEAQQLKTLVDPAIFPIAEYEGKMVGFFMGLPDYNIALKHVNGTLNIWGVLKFLWYRRTIDRARMITLCALPEFRRKMVPLALVYLTMKGGQQRGYKRAELSWIWEDNYPSRKITEASGGTIFKTYRVYEKELQLC
ncbi:MAG: hypothetical protein J7641_22250 [Cyanobacteria bacterium SID2]|nr:hypothetical protein [Cyanobacteria bacterium SID2]MBP0004496.1 hypothetical protein [Cyanobacteria bacterium SBC]